MTRKPDYQRNGITLYCGDCLEILPELEAGSVDAVVTDPPYQIPVGAAFVRTGGRVRPSSVVSGGGSRSMKWSSVLILTGAILAWACLLGLAFGAAPPVPSGLAPVKASIDGPDSIAAYKIVEMKVAGTWEAGGWRIRDITVGRTPLNADKRVIDALGTCLWTAPPGVYDVECTLVNFAQKAFFQDAKTVTIGNPQPMPEPEPQPNPTPSKLWGCIIIEESSRRTPAEAAVYTSQSVRSLLQSKGLEWRLVDKDAAQGSLATWASRAGADLPKMFAVSADGRPAYEGKVPADDKAMVDLIGRVAK